MEKTKMLKIAAVLLVMLMCLCGCKAEDNTGTVFADDTELTSVSEYFDKYDVLGYTGCSKGYVYIFDDESEYGVAVAAALDDAQMERIAALDLFSENYQKDMTAIVKETGDYTVTSLDGCTPDMSKYGKYVGQKVEVMMNDGFYETGSSVSENQSFLYLNNDTYEFQVNVAEKIDPNQDMNEDFEKSLTVQSLEFSGWGNNFYEGLFD